jgi:chromosome segregation ATPase
MRKALLILTLVLAGCSEREAELEKQVEEIHRGLHAEKGISADLRGNVDVLRQAIDDLKKQNGLLLAELATARDALQVHTAAKQALEQGNQNLTDQLAAVAMEQESLEDQLAQGKTRIRTLEDRLNPFAQQPKPAGASVAQTDARLSALMDEQKGLEGRVAALQAQINMQRSAVSTLLRERVEAYNTQTYRVVKPGRFSSQAEKDRAVAAAREELARLAALKVPLDERLKKVNEQVNALSKP